MHINNLIHESTASSTQYSLPTHFINAFELMCLVKYMAQTYEDNRPICKYVHSTSRGHEAIQIATGLQLTPSDFASP